MRRSGNDHELLFAAELLERGPVQFNHLEVKPADDQQRGRTDVRQGRSGQIRTSTSRHDSTYHVGTLGCRYQGRGGTGTGAEVPNAKVLRIRILSKPVC